MSKRCKLQKEYYKEFGNYKGSGKYTDHYVNWLESKVLAINYTHSCEKLPDFKFLNLLDGELCDYKTLNKLSGQKKDAQDVLRQVIKDYYKVNLDR